MDLTFFIKPEGLVTLLVGLSAFATVLTIAAPLFQGDQMKARMKSVAMERDRLRAAHRAALAETGKLRDRAQPGLIPQLVEILNLRKVFEAETTRDSLRQAGYRSERHLVYFLAARLITPIVLAVIFFVYSTQVLGATVPTSMRFAALAVGLVAGYYLPNVWIKNKTNRRQHSIKRAWSDAL